MLIRPADELRPPSVPCGPRCTSMRSISPSSLRPMPERERYTPSMNTGTELSRPGLSPTVPMPRIRADPLASEPVDERSEEHTSELQSLMRISYAVFCLKKKKKLTYIAATKKYTNT